MPKYGAIEAGGTKFLCAVADDPLKPRDLKRFSTSPSNPVETMAEVAEYFEKHGPIQALGVACFGPLDFAAGTISNTPKLSWQHFPIKGALERALHVPVTLDTDVNVAAYGEGHCSAADPLVYITVGTGIGGGVLVNGKLVHGKMHPEMGHVPVAMHPKEPAGFQGVCPFHRNCLEGLASGPAIAARSGIPAEQMEPEHPHWSIVADYLAQIAVTLACVLSPQVLVLGGGVMEQAHLIDRVRTLAEARMKNYAPLPEIRRPLLDYPALTGALYLAAGK